MVLKLLKARFIFILVIFLIPYGIVTTALLYPNELRLSESLEGIFFKPVLTLYGEMFLSEYTEYDFNDGLTCSKTSDIVELQTTDSEYRKRSEILLLETHYIEQNLIQWLVHVMWLPSTREKCVWFCRKK